MGCPVCGKEEFYKAQRSKDTLMLAPFFWVCKSCGVHLEDRRASGWETKQQN